MKRIISFFLIVCLLISVVAHCPISVFATERESAVVASGTCGDNITWTLDDEGLLTLSGSGMMSIGAIPWERYSSSIKIVRIGNGITNIDTLSFFNCENLREVTISKSVKEIGYGAFSMCTSLTNITIPDGVTTIGDTAFLQCTNLSSITIPDSVVSIGMMAFDVCNNLADVYYTGTSAQWAEISIGDLNQSLTNASVHFDEEDGDSDSLVAKGYCGGEGDGTNLAWSLDDQGTLTITGTGKMYTSSISPWESQGLTAAIKSVSMSEGITSIAYGAFSECTNVRNIEIPKTVTHIGYGAFSGTSLSEVVIPQNVVSIGDVAFGNNLNLAHIEVSPNNTSFSSVDGVLFNYEKTVLVCFPAGKNITSYTPPKTVKEIADTAFYRATKLQEIQLPSGIKTIGKHAFNSCSSLKTITIPNGVTSIEEYTFAYCDNLASITIPTSIAYINNHAFYRCSNLDSVHFGGTQTQWRKISIDDGNEPIENATIYYTGSSDSNVCTNHVWNAGTVTQKATCKEAGVKTYTCTKCSTTKTESIAKLTTHSYKSGWSKDGTNHWHECSVCQNKKDLAAHTPGAAATETTAQTCTTCGYVIQDAPGSTETNPPSTAPTDVTCTLSELTNIDYLAFSDISYRSIDKSKIGNITIRNIIGETKWTQNWKNTDIKNSELFSHIENWVVYDFKENEQSGFAAYIFMNDHNEFVIAYRGSIELTLLNSLNPDWLENDIAMFFGGNGTQVYEAILFAKEVIETYGSDSVAITGHSLGGALCDIVSACFSCYAESFNAAPFLANAYYYYPDEMGKNFTGAENWLFEDHITDGDFVGTLSLWMKNYVVYKYNQYDDGKHSLASMVTRDGLGNLFLTAIMDSSKQRGATLNKELYFGTASADKFSKPNSVWRYVVYAGDASDDIVTGTRDDVLVGGRGYDELAGGYGNDNYIYFKGDGRDYIYDISGNDDIYLYGFDSSDSIEAVDGGNTGFIHIQCNGQDIIRIYKQRAFTLLPTDSFKIHLVLSDKTIEKNITKLFNLVHFSKYITVSCPVNVEIIDESGNVVYTVEDAASGAYYTEYGNFYVYEEENGEYGKAINLVEGYSVRIVGIDEGTMDIAMWNVEDGVLSERCYVIESVEVTETMRASINEGNDGAVTLAVDKNGDGTVDDNHILSLVAGENTPSDESTQPTEGSTQPTEGTHANIPDNKDGEDTSLDIWWIAIAVVCVVAVGGVCVVFIIRKKKR